MQPLESRRLAALQGYSVLDTLPEARFDRLTQLAAELFDAPIALVSLLDKDRQWFKSHFGLAATQTPRDWAFCEHAIALGEHVTFVVEDAIADPRFEAKPKPRAFGSPRRALADRAADPQCRPSGSGRPPAPGQDH